MLLAMLTAAAFGLFATTATMWLFRTGGTSHLAAARLEGLRGDRHQQERQESAAEAALRRRTNVELYGVRVVSSNIAARWSTDLEQAGLTLNAKEYLIFRMTAGLFLVALGLLISPIPLLALLAFPAGFFLVGVWVQRRITSRRQKLEAQLIELLQMVASGLRAGFGFIQAMESSAAQMPDPISSEIRRTLRDIAVGSTVETALDALNKRVGSSDFDIAITAIMIQRTVGGNLAEILDSVSHTMRERERIRGEIRTLTSQQRLTGYVIGGIPPGLLGVFMLMSPEFMTPLFTDPIGQLFLAVGATLEVIGFLVIRKIVNIEV